MARECVDGGGWVMFRTEQLIAITGHRKYGFAVRFSLVSADYDETSRLYRWLQQRPEVTVTARSIDPTTMGALDIIDVALTHATAISSLVLAFVAWRQARPNVQSVTFTRPDGQKLTINGTADGHAEAIEKFLSDTGTAG